MWKSVDHNNYFTQCIHSSSPVMSVTVNVDKQTGMVADILRNDVTRVTIVHLLHDNMAKLYHLNFYPLEFGSRYCDT